MKRGIFSISANGIKLFVAVAMVADHAAWYYLKADSVPAMILHFFGNMCAPLMCFLIAEGYVHTRSVEKYALRLFAFAVISHIPFSLYVHRNIQLTPTSIIFTLLTALIAIYAFDHMPNKPLAVFVVLALAFITRYADWSYFAVLFAVLLFALRDRPALRGVAYSALSVVHILYGAFYQHLPYYRLIPMLGAFAVIPVILMYNGSRGKINSVAKWGFYIFYPLQFLALYLIKYIIFHA